MLHGIGVLEGSLSFTIDNKKNKKKTMVLLFIFSINKMSFDSASLDSLSFYRFCHEAAHLYSLLIARDVCNRKSLSDCYCKDFYYIQINEIQKNIDEITCIFQKVLFSLVKYIKSVISLVKNINFWMTSAFSVSCLCNSAVSLQIQADLSLRWAHCHFAGFVMRRLSFILF